MFQFLIGSLEAGDNEQAREFRAFQFLIGSLEAWLWKPRPCRPQEKFQFLIGSLEARNFRKGENRPPHVSIPHR